MKTHAKDRWWAVPRTWEGETAFILAGGPSLQGFDPDEIRGLGKVIVINTSYRLMYDADVLYFADTKWWEEHRREVRRCFLGQIITIDHPKLEGVRSCKMGPQLGLSKLQTTLHHGSNSGYQAINLAYLFGSKRIVLLGYDMRLDNGRTHWHNGHGREQNYSRRCQQWLKCLQTLVTPLDSAGVEVLNCTPNSALTCWPMRRLDSVVQEERLKQARRSRLGDPLTAVGGLYFVDRPNASHRLRQRSTGI